MTDDRSTRPLLSGILLLFTGTMILANIAGRMESTLLPLYIQELGATVNQVGLFFTLAAIAPLILQIVGGWISDSIGRLQAIAIGSIAGVLGYIVIFAAPTWEWLLLAAAARSMARAFVAPSFQAFIAEQADEDQLGRVYATVDMMYRIVGVVGPPLGGFISQRYGFRTMFLVAGIIYSAATVIRIVMARSARRGQTEPSERPTLKGLWVNMTQMAGLIMAGGVIMWVFVSDGIQDISFNVSEQLTPLYLQNLIGLTNTQIGSLTSEMFVATMLFTSFGGLVADKKGEYVSLAIGFSLYSMGQFLMVLGKSYVSFIVVWMLLGIGVAFVRPAFNSLISKNVPSRLRGMAFGLFSSSIGIFSLPAPLVGAFLWDAVDPRVPFLIPGIACALAVPLIWFKLRHDPTQSGNNIEGMA